MSNKTKLEQIFGEIQQSQWIDAARKRKENRQWLHYSQEIALVVLDQLDQQNITQKTLAERMRVSPQLVNKWLKGSENFTVETISKLEIALKINLIKIGVSSETKSSSREQKLPKFEEAYILGEKKDDFKGAKVIFMPSSEYSINAN